MQKSASPCFRYGCRNRYPDRRLHRPGTQQRVEIDTTLVASHVTVLKNYPFIGLMGYSAGENPLSYPEVQYNMVQQMVNAATKLVDYVILDCSSNMTNVFTPAAIESGDLIIRILTPDLKGVII